MPETLRITKKEDKEVRKKCVEINKILVEAGKMPVRESELIHILLKMALENIQIDKNGKMYVN